MALNCANTDNKIFSNFMVGETSGNQGQYFNFPICELCEKVVPVGFPMAELLDQARRDPRMQRCFPFGGPANGFDQFSGFDILE